MSTEPGAAHNSDDKLARSIRDRHWTDWRDFRFKPLDSPEVRHEVAALATQIRDSVRELVLIADAANAVETKDPNSGKTREVTYKPTSFKKPDYPVPDFKSAARQTQKPTYHAYTVKYDEVITAEALAGDADQLLRFHETLSKRCDEIRIDHSELFQKLEPLAGLGSHLAVTVLLDNSGSMRGRPQIEVAAWSVLLNEWLGRFATKWEILGYTTRAWKGGKSREAWVSDGKPSSPGRLNDLRHIIYKSFQDSGSKASINCAVMMSEALLKENIDGEALLWAYHRLIEQNAKSRYLFILSDGAPVDDSTLSLNPGAYLENHLINVAGWIETEQQVHLRAVGIGHKLRYYEFAREVTPSRAGIPVLNELSEAIGNSVAS